VCGFSFDGASACPACGSESQSAVITDDSFSNEHAMEQESDNSEAPNGEKQISQPDESPVSSEIFAPELPFDIEDAPTHDSDEALPYGLDFAPIYTEN